MGKPKPLHERPVPSTFAELRDLGPTVSITEAARALGISRATAYRLAKNGELPTARVGRSVRVQVEPLIRLMDPQAKPAKRKPKQEVVA